LLSVALTGVVIRPWSAGLGNRAASFKWRDWVTLGGKISSYWWQDNSYAVETAKRALGDRVLGSGDAVQLAEQPEALACLSPHTRDLALYMSDSRELAMDRAILSAQITYGQDGFAPNIGGLATPSVPEIELEGSGISL
jgi:hypothetical protein